MKTGIFDAGRIEAMLGHLKAAATRPDTGVALVETEKVADKVDFAAALKASLDQVNNVQHKAEVLTQRFAQNDDSVNLSDVMIAMQKANITFQATVQVRNKVVAAYQDIMNMQV